MSSGDRTSCSHRSLLGAANRAPALAQPVLSHSSVRVLATETSPDTIHFAQRLTLPSVYLQDLREHKLCCAFNVFTVCVCITGVSSLWDQGSKPRWALYAAAEFMGPCVGSPCAPADMVSLATGPGVYPPPPLLTPRPGELAAVGQLSVLLVPVGLVSRTCF